MKKFSTVTILMILLNLLCVCAVSADTPIPKDNEAVRGGVYAGATSDGSVSRRNDLRLVMRTILGTTNPHDINSINGELLVWNIYEGLFFVDDVGNLEPRLAEKYEVADDKVTYTVYLRKGVKFHNGTELKAHDVAYSFERARNFARMATLVSHIVSCKAVDDYTLKIVSDVPVALFMSQISSIKIVSQEDAEKFGESAGVDLEHTMAGTGPYYFTEFKPDTSIELTAFEGYYRGEAKIKKVHYSVINDMSTILVALEAGEIDFASISPAHVPVAQSDETLRVYLNPSTHASYIKFNWFDNKILADKRVRQAVCYALNKEEILYGCYDGYGDIAKNLAREGYVFGATNEGVNTYEHDPKKARALLVEAGYPDGVDIGSLWAIGTLYYAQGAQIMQQELAAVGITCSLQLLEQATVENTIFRGANHWGMAFHGGAMMVDSDRFYDWMFNPISGTYVGRGADNKRSAINPRLVELGEVGKTTLDPEKRKEIYKEFWKIAQDEAYVIALFHRYNPYSANKLLNVKLYTTYYYLYDWSWQ